MHTIIGINGITGQEIARELQRRHIPLRGVSRNPAPGPWESVAADALDSAALVKALAGSEVAYCCVGLAYDTKIWERDWPVLIDNVIEACLTTGAKLIFLDNVYMYGLVEGPMTEDSPLRPVSRKGRVRQIVAEKVLDAFERRGLKGCIARSADFYGPGCAASMLTESVFNNLAKGKPVQWIGRLDKKHNFTYTEDIGRACVRLALSDQIKGDVWHLPTSEAMTGRQFVDMAAKEWDTTPKITTIRGPFLSVLGWFIPILREVKEMMYQYNHDYVFSSAKYERAFGEKPTPYATGIRETVRAQKEHTAKK